MIVSVPLSSLLDAAPPPPHEPRITEETTATAASVSREDSLRNASKFTVDSLSLAPAIINLRKLAGYSGLLKRNFQLLASTISRGSAACGEGMRPCSKVERRTTGSSARGKT